MPIPSTKNASTETTQKLSQTDNVSPSIYLTFQQGSRLLASPSFITFFPWVPSGLILLIFLQLLRFILVLPVTISSSSLKVDLSRGLALCSSHINSVPGSSRWPHTAPFNHHPSNDNPTQISIGLSNATQNYTPGFLVWQVRNLEVNTPFSQVTNWKINNFS